MGVSNNNGTPKSSILVGFSIIFTIHFGCFPPIFGSTPIYLHFFQLQPNYGPSYRPNHKQLSGYNTKGGGV